MNRKLITGIICIIISFVLMLALSSPTLNEKTIKFDSKYKETDVTIYGSYFEVKNSKYAVLICPGYSCDRSKWRVMADLLAYNGLTVMTFDYSGQGESSSVIGFDNAKTDCIAEEIDDALEFLHNKSSIPYENIILMGHSMGGRSILRLLYDYNNEKAVTNTKYKAVKNAILISPEVNYEYNAQASVFAGTSDESEEPWRSYSENDVKDTNIYLFGSTSDDIVSDVDIIAIYNRIGGNTDQKNGVIDEISINSYGGKALVKVVPGVLHSYQMYSTKFASLVNLALSDILNSEMRYKPLTFSFVYFSWIFGLLGLYLTLSSINMKNEKTSDCNLRIYDIKKFLWFKLLMWIPGFIAAFIICCICVVLPFGSPVMNLPYMCSISGYGLVMYFLYRKERVKGVDGKINKNRNKTEITFSFKKCLIPFTLCLYLWFVLRCSMYKLIPFNYRLFWVLFAGVLMSIGYYVSSYENDMLRLSSVSKKHIFIYNLIQYVALILLVAFYGVIKSYSGFIGQIQNMLLMYIFCIPVGKYIEDAFSSRVVGAFTTGFLFQTLMITSSALIAIF